MNNSSRRRWYQRFTLPKNVMAHAGLLATLLACYYVVNQIMDSSALTDPRWVSPAIWGWIVLCSLIYGLTGFLLTRAWLTQHNCWSEHPLQFMDAASIYARSQILKYIPSNLFHVAGRYALLVKRGERHWVIVFSTFTEIVSLAVGALILSSLFVVEILEHFLGGWAAQWTELASHSKLIVLLVSALLGAWVLFAVVRSKARSSAGKLGLLVGLALHLLFFSVTGFIALLLLRGGGFQFELRNFHELTGLMALGWLVGFVTPGAPAGVGLREMVLIAGFEPYSDPATAIFLAGSYRIATLAGDGLFAFWGWSVLRLRPQ